MGTASFSRITYCLKLNWQVSHQLPLLPKKTFEACFQEGGNLLTMGHLLCCLLKLDHVWIPMPDACGKVQASHACPTILAGRCCSCTNSPDCFYFCFLIHWLPRKWETVCRIRPTNVLFPSGNPGIFFVFSWLACSKILPSLHKNFHASYKDDSVTLATSATSSSQWQHSLKWLCSPITNRSISL